METREMPFVCLTCSLMLDVVLLSDIWVASICQGIGLPGISSSSEA